MSDSHQNRDHLSNLLYELYFGRNARCQEEDEEAVHLYNKNQCLELLSDVGRNVSKTKSLSELVLNRHTPTSLFQKFACDGEDLDAHSIRLVDSFNCARPCTWKQSNNRVVLCMMIGTRLITQESLDDDWTSQYSVSDYQKALIRFYRSVLYHEKSEVEWARDFFNCSTVHLFMLDSIQNTSLSLLGALTFSFASTFTDHAVAYIHLIRSERKLDISPNNIVFVMDGMFLDEFGNITPTKFNDCIDTVGSMNETTFYGSLSQKKHNIPCRNDVNAHVLMEMLQSMLVYMHGKKGFTLLTSSIGYTYHKSALVCGKTNVKAKELAYTYIHESKGREFWKKIMTHSREATLLGQQLVLSGDVDVCDDCLFMSRRCA